MKKNSFEVSGNIIDVVAGKIFRGTVVISNGTIAEIREEETSGKNFILPGLIDAHIHIESSMLIPSEFGRLAVAHGTVATVSDPHEIGNVLGTEGVRFMISNGKKIPFHFYFGAPSCVPATGFETAGAKITSEEIEELFHSKDIWYLSEMMNFPGVIFRDEEVIRKLSLARKFHKPVDGHAPGLTGDQLRKYAGEGITTDHECFTKEEALEKINVGMKILIREGSAAKNFDALCDLIEEHPEMVMLCSDDKHPDDLAGGHINLLVKRALKKGYDPMKVLRSCTLNPVKHYGLDTGLLQSGDPADFILVDNLSDFNVLQTFIRGEKVAEKGKSLITKVNEKPLNIFHAKPISESDLGVSWSGGKMKVIKALDGQLITDSIEADPLVIDGKVECDLSRDILKIVVLNRYQSAPPAIGFIQGFGLQTGAIASSVAHDSHNIIAVGTDDSSIKNAINAVIESKGGIVISSGGNTSVLPLPVAGIMSPEDGYLVAEKYEKIDKRTKALGSMLKAPFMTLSFMALLVIPNLKISDKGLFDGNKFSFSELFCH